MTEDSESTKHSMAGIEGVPPPPGWYEHHTGETRWWDGNQWTEHRQVAEPPSPADTYDDNSRVQQVEIVGFGELPDTSDLKKWWCWLLAVAFPPAGYVLAFLIYQRAGEFLYPVGFVFVSTIALLWWSSVLS